MSWPSFSNNNKFWDRSENFYIINTLSTINLSVLSRLFSVPLKWLNNTLFNIGLLMSWYFIDIYLRRKPNEIFNRFKTVLYVIKLLIWEKLENKYCGWKSYFENIVALTIGNNTTWTTHGASKLSRTDSTLKHVAVNKSSKSIALQVFGIWYWPH